MAVSLDERLYDYLNTQEIAKSIGEINGESQFRDIPRREIAQCLQRMTAQGDAFRSLKDGKAYYSTKIGDGLSRNPGQQRLADLQHTLNDSFGRTEEEQAVKDIGKALKQLGDLVGRDCEDMPYAVRVEDIQFTFLDQNLIDCDTYMMTMPDGFVRVDEPGRQFVAYLKNPKAEDEDWNMGGSFIQVMDSTVTPMDALKQTPLHLLDTYSATYEIIYWATQKEMMSSAFETVDFFPIKTKTTAGGATHASDGFCHHYYLMYFNGEGYKQIRFQIDNVIGDEAEIRKLVLQIADTFTLKKPVKPLRSLTDPYFLSGELSEEKAKEWCELLLQTDNEYGVLWNMRNSAEEQRSACEQREGTFSAIQFKKRVRESLKERVSSVDYILEQAVVFCETIKQNQLENPNILFIYKELESYIQQRKSFKMELDEGDLIETSATIEDVKAKLFTEEISAMFKHQEEQQRQKEADEEKRRVDEIAEMLPAFCKECRDNFKLFTTPWIEVEKICKRKREAQPYDKYHKWDFNLVKALDRHQNYDPTFDCFLEEVDAGGEAFLKAGGDDRVTKAVYEMMHEIVMAAYDQRTDKFPAKTRKILMRWRDQYEASPQIQAMLEEEKRMLDEQRAQTWKENASVVAELREGLKVTRDVIYGGQNGYCIIMPDGLVKTFGLKETLQKEVVKWRNIVGIGIGRDHVVGLREDGSVVAAGDNEFNQCNVNEWKNIVKIAVGYNHTVGLKADGTVVATGLNDTDYHHCSQSGLGRCEVSDWCDIVDIAVGSSATIGLKKDGTLRVCGDVMKPSVDFNNKNYAFRDIDQWPPVIEIAARDNNVFGLTESGQVVTTLINFKEAEWYDMVSISSLTGGEFEIIGVRLDGTVLCQWDPPKGDDIVLAYQDDALFAVGKGSYRNQKDCLVLKRDGTLVHHTEDGVQIEVEGIRFFNDYRTIQAEKTEAVKKEIDTLEKQLEQAKVDLANTKGLFSGGKKKRLESDIERFENQLVVLKAKLQ